MRETSIIYRWPGDEGDIHHLSWRKLLYNLENLLFVFLFDNWFFNNSFFLEYWLQFFWKFFQLSRFLNIYIVAVKFLSFFWNKNIFCKRILTHFRSNSWSQRLQGKKNKEKKRKCQKDYLRFLYQRERWWMLGLPIYVLGFTNWIKFIKICYRYVGVYSLT